MKQKNITPRVKCASREVEKEEAAKSNDPVYSKYRNLQESIYYTTKCTS
jgi:hypothetical protein